MITVGTRCGPTISRTAASVDISMSGIFPPNVSTMVSHSAGFNESLDGIPDEAMDGVLFRYLDSIVIY